MLKEVESSVQAEGRRLLIGDIIRRAAATAADRPAVAVGPDQRTYAELEREAERLAHALRSELGIGHGDRVLGWIDTAVEVMPLFVALARLGAVFAPLNARLSAEEAGDVAKLARARLLVVDPARAADAERLAKGAGIERIAVLSVLRTLGDESAGRPAGDSARGAVRTRSAGSGETAGSASANRYFTLDAMRLPDPPTPIFEPRLIETDPHVIFFTSGSTGRPKGVVLSHRANWLRGFQGVFRDEPERTVCMFPLFHMAGFTLAISAWQTRGEIAYTTASADAILRMVEARRANRIYGLPVVWKRILEADLAAYDLSSLDQLDTGTSATPIELLRDMKARFPRARIRIYYGSTEVGTANALSDADVLRKPGSVGPAAVSVDVRLAADGEICVRSPFLCDGYFDDPQATDAAMIDGWFHTGDLGAMDAEGHLSIIGRKKEILRTGGESVSPAEVESVLRDAPGVEDVALVGLPDPHWGDLLCAAIVVKEGAEVTLAALQAHCEGKLAGFKKPRRIARLAALPRTAATNQVQRTLLVEQIVSNGLARDA
jgi:acyl-CoA synthetase (AMP-forming)/AMP-acid ligase II